MLYAAQFDRLVDIITWGVDFQRDFKEDDNFYSLGTVEATGFIASCCVVQWFGFTEGLVWFEVCTALKLSKYPKRKKIRKRLKKLFKSLGLPDPDYSPPVA